MPPELLLIRHGQSQSNVGLSTDPDSPLTDLGLRQSHQVAAQLSSHDLKTFTCLTSPYQRARQTADIISAATHTHFKIDPAIREWGPGATVNGQLYPEEPIADVVLRLRAFLSVHRARNLLLVTHATPIALLLHLAKGQSPITTGPFWQGIENCCLHRLQHCCNT
jgi:broad specificity phosphatase PhoE